MTTTPNLPEVIAFLQGEVPLEGVWYGEPHPSGKPYWWRTHLREALAAAPEPPAPGVGRYERMFNAAVAALAEISVALGIPDDVAEVADGNEEMLARIAELVRRSPNARPVAWALDGLIRDDDGTPIGTDETRIRWQAECPDHSEGWMPLYNGPPAPSAGVSVSEGLIGSVSPVMGQVDAVSPAMVERALDAYSAYWCEPPNTQACCECDGKGISGIADTAGGCDACGGLGWTSAGGDDREAMRAALTAAAQVRANDSGVG
jgi:hypothetical protein